MQGRPLPRRSSSGLTIIELAFTISIVGLLLFLTLKGTVMIESFRAVAVSYELEQHQRLVVGYQTDFRALPGDDPQAASRWRREPALTTIALGVPASLVGNDVLDGKLYDFSSPTGEQFTLWRDLRYAGMIDGNPALQGQSSLPENPFGGFYGFDEGNLGQKSGSFCATKIPGRAAEIIDKKLDDGKINSGKLIGTAKFSIEENNHFPAPDTAPYDIEKEYIICVPLLP